MSQVTWYVALGVLNIPLYVFVGRLLFADWDGFFEAVKFWFKPDMWSWFDGEYWEDWVAELKLGVLLAVSAGAVVGVYWLIDRFFLS